MSRRTLSNNFYNSARYSNISASFNRCLMVCRLLRSPLELAQVRWGRRITRVCQVTSIWVLPVCQTLLYPNIFMFNRDPINIRLDIRRGHLCHRLIKITFLISHRGMFDLFSFYRNANLKTCSNQNNYKFMNISKFCNVFLHKLLYAVTHTHFYGVI